MENSHIHTSEPFEKKNMAKQTIECLNTDKNWRKNQNINKNINIKYF